MMGCRVSVRRSLWLSALLLSSLSGVSQAEQLAIEHKDVACFVAGQFPVLDACFNPGRGLARARVFFRPEGSPSWYYVEAKTLAEAKAGATPDAACRKAILPKPKKSLLKTRVEYYVEATGKAMETSQTETYRPLVVASEGECKNKLVAPYLPTAAVQVFPALPAAFAAGGGLSTVAVAAVVGAGVAGTTGAVVATTGGSNPSPTVTQPASPTTTAPPVTVPPTTATTTQPPAASFNPVYKVFRNGVLEPGSTIAGTEPLQLRLYMCDSTGPSKLKFQVSVNGAGATAGCDSTITFNAGGFTAGFGAVVRSYGHVGSSATSYSVLMQMQSDAPGNDPKDSRSLTVQVDAVPPPTTTSTTSTTSTSTTSTSTSTTTTSTFIPCTGPPPPIVLVKPTPTTFPTDSSVDFQADVTESPLNPGTVHVDYFIFYPNIEVGTDLFASADPPLDASSFNVTWDSASIHSFLCDQLGVQNATVRVSATASDACQLTSNPTPAVDIDISTASCPTAGVIAPPAAKGSARTRDSRPLPPGTWVSQLDVPGARGQMVVNGNAAFFPPAGRSGVSARVKAGENRVEATLVQATGQSGLWRFDLSGEHAFTPGSLRVIAGQVALITGDTVVFQMKGRPGERLVFTFQSR